MIRRNVIKRVGTYRGISLHDLFLLEMKHRNSIITEKLINLRLYQFIIVVYQIFNIYQIR